MKLDTKRKRRAHRKAQANGWVPRWQEHMQTFRHKILGVWHPKPQPTPKYLPDLSNKHRMAVRKLRREAEGKR